MRYRHPMSVRMYDTDAAGILYFGSHFRFAHDAFESLMEHEGFSFQRFFDKESFLFVVVHAESDYFVPLKCADRIEIEVVVEHIGTTSFTIRYDVFREGISTGRMKTVHVCIDKSTRKKRPLPDEAILFLNKYKESH